MTRLFVYGIFLDEPMRRAYGMTRPEYATVRDYVTYGGSIVTAYKQEGAGLALTGLLVTPDPERWEDLDRLERSYDRILISTTDGDNAYMYVGKEVK